MAIFGSLGKALGLGTAQELVTEVTGSKVASQAKKPVVKVQYTDSEGEQEASFDKLIVAVGRRPFTENVLDANVGVELDERGFIKVNDQCATSVPGIYAVGDAVRGPMLAHKGSKEGLVAAAVIAGHPERYDARCVPAVIFTAPEMASVGLTEEQCKEQGREYRTGSFPFAASGRAMSLMETEGFVKIVSDAKTDEVLGVHMVGPEVTELIAEAALAIELGATVEDIARTIHAHPTLPEAMMEAAEAVHSMAVHIFQKPTSRS